MRYDNVVREVSSIRIAGNRWHYMEHYHTISGKFLFIIIIYLRDCVKNLGQSGTRLHLLSITYHDPGTLTGTVLMCAVRVTGRFASV